MKQITLYGPADMREALADSSRALWLEMTPFQPNFRTENDLRILRDSSSPERKRCGVFRSAPLHEILYLLTEDLLNMAVFSQISEKDLQRVAETTGKPLYLMADPTEKQLPQKERAYAVTGLCFTAEPSEDVQNQLKKPWLLLAADKKK